MSKKPELFGTDGVRGTVGKFPLVPEFVVKLGTATGAVMSKGQAAPTVLIGRDTRQSGQMLQSALTAGLLASGATVIDLGVMPTPGVAFLVNKLGAQAGVVISASHNPVEQNGIKIINADGSKLPESTEVEIERMAGNTELHATAPVHGYGRCLDGAGFRELYVAGLLAEHPELDLSAVTVVIDCANGAASSYAPECFARLGAKTITINASPTGVNINRFAGSEQVRKYPRDLFTLMQQHSAQFGIAFDGDADRAVFVDDRGELVDGDHILAILATYLQDHGKLLGNTIVATNMRNQGLVEFVQQRKINYIETKVGDKYVTEKLVALAKDDPQGAFIGLGGEQAGHIILYDPTHNTGDGIRTALWMIKAFVALKAESLSALAACVRKAPQVIASAHVTGKPALESIDELEQIKKSLTKELPDMQRMELRYSGTEPVFRAMLEGGFNNTEQELADMAWKMCRAVQKAAGVTARHPDSIEILNVSRGGLMIPHIEE